MEKFVYCKKKTQKKVKICSGTTPTSFKKKSDKKISNGTIFKAPPLTESPLLIKLKVASSNQKNNFLFVPKIFSKKKPILKKFRMKKKNNNNKCLCFCCRWKKIEREWFLPKTTYNMKKEFYHHNQIDLFLFVDYKPVSALLDLLK